MEKSLLQEPVGSCSSAPTMSLSLGSSSSPINNNNNNNKFTDVPSVSAVNSGVTTSGNSTHFPGNPGKLIQLYSSRVNSIDTGNLGPARAVREPVDPSRYVIMRDLDNAVVYQCALCSNRYVHRKSLNKHWNDKHSGRSSVEPNVATRKSSSLFERIRLVECGTDEMANRRHSLAHLPPPPVAHTSTLPRDDLRQSDNNFVGQPVNLGFIPPAHRRSLPLDTFHILSSPCPDCPPISTPIARNILSNFTPPNVAHFNADHRLSDVASLGMTGDHVLDLSINSQNNSLNVSDSVTNDDDRPLDFSFKSLSNQHISQQNLPRNSVLQPPAAGAVLPTTNGSTFTYAGEDTLLVLPNMPEEASIPSEMDVKLLETLRKSMILAAHDSIAILRRLHYKMTNFVDVSNVTVATPMPSSSGVAIATGVNTESATVKPDSAVTKRPCRCLLDHSNRTSELKDRLRFATRDQTHEFFGGIAAYGQLRCRDCNFRATDMIGFSCHVVRHVSSGKKAVNERQNDEKEQHGRCTTRKNRFLTFLGLGLSKSSSQEEESLICDGRDAGCSCVCHSGMSDSGNEQVLKSVPGSCGSNNIHQRASPLSGNSEMRNPAAHVVSGVEMESPGKMDVGKIRRPYPRGLGLTTTESTTAAGRSCRMRRLRHCERCSYVTDNLTTLRRHETKHGSAATHHCMLCDYAVNQLHTLNYHMRRVHGQQPDIIKSTRRRGKSIATNGFIPVDIKPDVSIPSSPVVLENCTSALTESADGSGVDGAADSIAVVENCSLEKLEEMSHRAVLQNEVESSESPALILRDICADNSIANPDPKIATKIDKKMRPKAAGIGARYRLLDSYGLRPGRGVCVRCGFRCLCAAGLKRHILAHADARRKCANCSHRASSSRLLKRHVQRHHEELNATPLTHKEPQARRRMYPCSHCPFQGASKDRLQRHEAFHGVRRQHVCGKCTYSIDRMNLIVLHRRLHTDADATGSARPTTAKAVKLLCRLHCVDCPYATCSAAALAVHRRGHRVVQRRFSCVVCGFGTDVSNVYFQHKRLHSHAFVR